MCRIHIHILNTNGRKLVCLCTAPPNLCWRHLLWQPSYCRPFPLPRPSPSSEGSSRGLRLLHMHGLPWYVGVCDAMYVVEPVVLTSVEGAACEVGPAVALAMLQPLGPASSETLSWGERCHSWRRPWVFAWPEHDLFPGTIFAGWGTACSLWNWPWE